MEYVLYKKAENVTLTFARYHAEGYEIYSVMRALFSTFCYLFNGELITAGFFITVLMIPLARERKW